MEPRYREQLPADVLGLLNDIESNAGVEILVRVDRTPQDIESADPDRLALLIDAETATILIREAGVLPPRGALHELLHIHRFWIEGVPQVRIAEPWQKASAEVDNALEHFVIVPRERSYSVGQSSHWVDTMRHNWSRRWPQMLGAVEAETLRIRGLLGWATTIHLADEPDVVEMAREALGTARLLDDADLFCKNLGEVIPSKEKMTQVTFTALAIPDLCWRLQPVRGRPS